MKPTALILFVVYISYGVQAFLLGNIGNLGSLGNLGNFQSCHEGDYWWNTCLACKCNNLLPGCLFCDIYCAGEQLENHCPVNASSTAASVTHSSVCDELKVFEVVTLMQFVYNDHGRRCSDGSNHDDDALVMTLCSAPPSSKWIDGEHVWQNNKCSLIIKPYTPVYFYEGQTKYPAIFVSCTDTGIKVVH